MAIDYQVTLFLNALASSNAYVTDTVSALASGSAYALVGVLFYFWQKTKPSLKKVHVDMIIVALLSGFLARFLLKFMITTFFERARPYIAHGDIVVLIKPPLHEEMLSFPSGHALFFFAMSTVVYRHHKKLGIIFYVVSVVMALARVAVGVHYPTDVFVGALFGVGVALLCMKLTRKLLPL